MASLKELEEGINLLSSFHRDLGEELERLNDVHNPEIRTTLIKRIQIRMFEMALKLPFTYKGH